MPTPLPSNQKTAFINLVKVAPYPGGILEAGILQGLLNNYEDVANAFFRQLYLFAANHSYLVEAISIFTNLSALNNVGVYFNQSIASTVVNPQLIIDSQIVSTPSSSSGIIIGQDSNLLAVMGTSYVDNVYVNAGKNLEYFFIGPQSEVDLLDSSATTNDSPFGFARVGSLWIPFLKNGGGRLNGAAPYSNIGTPNVDTGAYYGGILSYDPNIDCSNPVTNLNAGDITHNSVTLLWTPPLSNYIFINVFYKKAESPSWILADQTVGEYIQQSGFVFRELSADTYYDFMVRVQCNNGGVSSTTISAKTVCCGTNSIQVTTECLVTVYIKASPDSSKTITLCNGAVIQQEYPEGATLQIPYFTNKIITDVLIIDNNYYQNFPWNPISGTWTATGTPLQVFQEPNVISIKVQLPISA